MNNYKFVKTLSKDGMKTTELFLLKGKKETRYFIINFVGFKVKNGMEICKKTYRQLLMN